jgi:predicted oxidoreductase
VTRLGFGALEIGRNWGIGDANATQRPDAESAAQMLNGVLESGVNLIDSARAYHRSEERIDETLRAPRRIRSRHQVRRRQRRAEHLLRFFLQRDCGIHRFKPRKTTHRLCRFFADSFRPKPAKSTGRRRNRAR